MAIFNCYVSSPEGKPYTYLKNTNCLSIDGGSSNVTPGVHQQKHTGTGDQSVFLTFLRHVLSTSSFNLVAPKHPCHPSSPFFNIGPYLGKTMEKPVHHIETTTTKPRAKPCSDQGSLPSDGSAAHPTRPGPSSVAVTVEVNTLGIHDWNLPSGELT